MRSVIYFLFIGVFGLSSHVSHFYQTTGQLESVEPAEAGAYLISFKSRVAAEQVSHFPPLITFHCSRII